jgi:hypothetical protein
VVSFVEAGDHSLFVGEAMEAEVTEIPKGRADDATLWLEELGEMVFYGGELLGLRSFDGCARQGLNLRPIDDEFPHFIKSTYPNPRKHL